MTARIWLAVLAGLRIAGPIVETWKCDNCGRVNSDSVVTCTGCGA